MTHEEKRQIYRQGKYILETLENITMNGDAYCGSDFLFQRCQHDWKNLSAARFAQDKAALIRAEYLHQEGYHIYDQRTWNYEEAAAQDLAAIIPKLIMHSTRPIPSSLKCGEIELNDRQKEAIMLALSNPISLILGGAGSGKTTLIRTLVSSHARDGCTVVAAPTGKAAQNLRERTEIPARTVHSALGKTPDDDFLDNISWAKTELIIIDEASMMTLEMLAGILHRAPVSSHIVLLGDPNQLLSVGTGNVIPDLLALGIPHVDLEQQYRQNADASALRHNVLEFPRLTSSDQFQWDDSFRMVDANDEDIARIICEEAARRYRMGESVQVLSPTNYSSDCSVDALNKKIQDQVNPLTKETPVWENLHHMDRVLVTQNDYERGIYNGETGILWINELKQCAALLLDTHMTIFDTSKPPVHLKLAYAMTVHKSQGSQYDTIIMPASMAQSKMLSRNLLYTAISRAKKQVILVGSRSAVHVTMQRTLPPRRSKLVAKTNMRLYARRIA